MNNSGKTLTIFLIVIAVLLVSLTIISVFFFLEEVELRKSAEYNLEQISVIKAKLQGDLQEANKQNFVFEEKTREADGKIESLLEDLELEQGLREEIKKENRELREAVETESQAREELRAKMNATLDEADARVVQLESEIDVLRSENQQLLDSRDKMEVENQQLKTQSAVAPSAESMGAADNVDLDLIVVNPAAERRGKIISVDKETDFVIINLGEKDGVEKDALVAIYRDDNYIGDVRISRVLPEMSAADFIPPLTSQQVRKDDRAVLKQ